MFIFYYAVLSEVSPPTALSPFAAAAITGGNPVQDDAPILKYTLPAFIFPFTFVVEPPRALESSSRGVDDRGLDQPHGRHRDRGLAAACRGAVQENLASGALAPDRRGILLSIQAAVDAIGIGTGGRRGRHAARFPAPFSGFSPPGE